MLLKFGAAYTWQSLDDMPLLDFIYIQYCIEGQSKREEMAMKGRAPQPPAKTNRHEVSVFAKN